jgi:hypothetical protein
VSAMPDDKKGVVLSDEQLKRRRRRSVAAIFYASTIVKLGPGAAKRSEIVTVTVPA